MSLTFIIYNRKSIMVRTFGKVIKNLDMIFFRKLFLPASGCVSLKEFYYSFSLFISYLSPPQPAGCVTATPLLLLLKKIVAPFFYPDKSGPNQKRRLMQLLVKMRIIDPNWFCEFTIHHWPFIIDHSPFHSQLFFPMKSSWKNT